MLNLEKEFASFRQEAFEFIKASSPYKTGKLRANIKLQYTNTSFMIIIDIDYMQYTEEPWLYNSRWKKTLVNPNLYWLKNAVFQLAQRFASKLKGVVKYAN